MFLLASVVFVVLLVFLVLIEAGQATHANTSLFELRRRRAAKDSKAADTLRREELLVQAGMLKTPLSGILIIGVVFLSLYLLDGYKGFAVAFVSVVLYGRIARLGAVRKFAHRLYAKYETRVLDFVARRENLFRFVVGKTSLSQPTVPLGSREELAHLLEVSPIFSDEDKTVLESVLRFNDQTVADTMTKKADLVVVKPGELLGPLVLDDLHKTKHEIFPVEDKGDIIGMLDIRDHVALKRKESVFARDVMHTGVVHIAETEPLDEALKVLMAAKQPYLIVTNDDEQVVGMLGLGDVIRALMGWSRR